MAAPRRSSYLCDLIDELKHLADRSGQRTLAAIARRGPHRGAHARTTSTQSAETPARRWQRSETTPPPCRSMRPASASSISAICTLRMPRPVARRARRCRPAPGRAPRPFARDRPRDGGGAGAGAGGARILAQLPDRRARHRRQRRQHVLRLGDQRGARLQQLLVPSARGSSGWPGTANTSRPCSAASRAVIERARSPRRLDHDDAQRQTGDDAVAAREILAARLEAERHLGDQAAGSPIWPAARRARADRCCRCRRPAPRRCRWRAPPGAPPHRCRGPAPRRRRSRRGRSRARTGAPSSAPAAEHCGRRRWRWSGAGGARVALDVEQRRRRIERGQRRRIIAAR